MKIIFDFDRTLFSTKNFCFAFKEEFLKLGVDEKLFKKTFKRSKKGKGKYYIPEEQFKLIHKSNSEIEIKQLKKSFEKKLKKAKRFLYNDVFWFFKKWSHKVDFILISYGQNKFQREKIENSKIGKYFKKIIITQDIEKLKPFKKIFIKREKIIFVEDNPQALLKVKKNFKNIITVRINRKDRKYSQILNSKEINFSIKNLKELDRILKILISKNNLKV